MTKQTLLSQLSRLPRPSSEAAAERGLETFLSSAAQAPEHHAQALAVAEDPQSTPLLNAVFGNSPYLTQTIIRDLPFFLALLHRTPDDALRDILDSLTYRANTPPPPRADTMRLLRKTKAQAALLIAIADIGNVWPLATITGALSAVAEASITHAINALLAEAARKGDFELAHPDQPGKQSGYTVIAMGKLGAGELNFSSDIDLIPLFDPDVAQYTGKKSVQDAFVRLTQGLVQILQERTADGYVYRTDLRLRPDAGATPVAMSVRAAETYYESVGQNWERAAMIKARPVGGDLETGHIFLETIRPFVWRKHLDYAAIADIHSIKRQIDSSRGHTQIKVAGHNIKLGHGGIREIEFFAQTQQLIAGGREPALREITTCGALRALESTHRIDAAATNDLVAAYDFLRTLEHRLQMIADEQTQTLPGYDAGLDQIATFMGFDDRAGFGETLIRHLNAVREHYGGLFEDAPALGGESGNLVFTGADDDPDTLETLTEMGFREAKTVSGAFRRWHHGRYRATRSTRAREMLTALTPRLLNAFGATANPDSAFLRFDEFLEKLPAGIQLFSLFYNNPSLLDLLAEIVGSAPRLAEFLARDPLVLDSVLGEGFLDPVPDGATLAEEAVEHIAQSTDYQDALDMARRWTRDRRLQAGVHVLRNIMPGHRSGPILSDIADAVINALMPSVIEDFARRHGVVPDASLAIVALGKLGSREMMFGSDLDLIFVYDNPKDEPGSDGPKPLPVSQYFARLGQQIISAITSLTAEGRLYEVDMRLRPSGASGPLAVNIAGFENYQRTEAWTWEQMALTRARVIYATDPLRDQLEPLIDAILQEPREASTVLHDVADMRLKVAAEFPGMGVWSLKFVRGGLLDLEFIAQGLQLTTASRSPSVLHRPTASVFEAIDEEQLDAQIAQPLAETTRLFQDIEGLFRLCLEGAPTDETIPPGLVRALCRVANMPDLATLKAELLVRQSVVTDAYEQLVGRFGPEAAT